MTGDILVFPEGRLQFGNMSWRCALGRNGRRRAVDKREGDGCTPAGRWPLRYGYYRADRLPAPQTRLAMTPLHSRQGWCDAPDHPLYNRPVMLPFEGSCERLWRDDGVYDVIIVLGHNDAPPRPGLGSAIFLHVARPDYSPTEGCVALALPDLRALLSSIPQRSHLHILED